MEHSVDLLAKTFVQAVSLSPARKILKKMKKALQVTSDDGSGTFDLDDLNTHLANFDFDDDTNEEIESDGGEEEGAQEEEVDAADSLGKALLLVKQVCLGCYNRGFRGAPTWPQLACQLSHNCYNNFTKLEHPN